MTDIITPEAARSAQAERQRIEPTPEMAIAQTVIPYPRDDPKARYLGLRASGFTIREALKLIGYGHSALSMWRRDEAFAEVEIKLPEYRQRLANEYVHLEFIRNYRLVLEKDYRVLQHSIHPDKDEDGNAKPMSSQDHSYLLKARSHYTPQQLEIIEALMSGTEPGKEFNFTDFILAAAQTKQRVTLESKKATFEVVTNASETDS